MLKQTITDNPLDLLKMIWVDGQDQSQEYDGWPLELHVVKHCLEVNGVNMDDLAALCDDSEDAREALALGKPKMPSIAGPEGPPGRSGPNGEPGGRGLPGPRPGIMGPQGLAHEAAS
ncbi:MAG: collagen-like protein [Alphaproteobacteria bacterium]|nr:collagen-like protein [Alphaproteobacteria bacterium]